MFRQRPLPWVSFFLLCAALILTTAPPAFSDDWLPINPADLAMKDNPAAPGAHAMILYRYLYTQDVESYEDQYYRIKIFTEEGKKHANIEIPFLREVFRIGGIKARTIKPDGTIVNFDGKVFEKVVVKTHSARILAKTFTLPDVQVGSIIEYRFRKSWDRSLLLNTRWILHEDLFTRRADFSVTPYSGADVPVGLAWVTLRSPGNVSPQKQKNGAYGMTIENIPAFQDEPYSPPENELKGRIDLFYTAEDTTKPEVFWKKRGKEWFDASEQFMNKKNAMKAAVDPLVSPADSPEVKLQKIYARVQQIRNLSFESTKTEKEEKREKLKDNNHVEDLWKNGYGFWREINRLFVALARAAGFDAAVVRVSERDDYFFQPNTLDSRQLNGEVAWVSAGGQEYYLDPGTAFCPFGILSWESTGVRGLKLDKTGGAWVDTPTTPGASAVTQRIASLKLSDDGSVSGTLQVSFTGLEALRRRLINFEEDDATKQKEMEDEIKTWVPVGSTLKIESITGWASVNDPLVVKARLEIPGLAAATGRRMLVPAGVFQTRSRHPFQSKDRKHPVYFRHAYMTQDDVTLELPSGWEVESQPAPRDSTQQFATFKTQALKNGNTLRLQRQFSIEGILFMSQYYPLVRSFYDSAKAADEEQAVLKAAASAAK